MRIHLNAIESYSLRRKSLGTAVTYSRMKTPIIKVYLTRPIIDSDQIRLLLVNQNLTKQILISFHNKINEIKIVSHL